MLALVALALMALPIHVGAASAQIAPDGCLDDPSSCLPPPPPPPSPPVLDPCVEDPASCLPPPPPLPSPPAVDQCLEDPASCLPSTPPVDECVADPQSCLPDTGEVDRCLDDPKSCLPQEVRDELELVLGDDESPKEDEREESFTTPVKGGKPPRGTRGDTSSTSGQGADAAAGSRPTGVTGTVLAESPAVALVPGSQGLLDRVAEGLADAAKRFAFPLAVAALVAAFLIVQGRIDRGDPKLAAAPVDGRDDVVQFR